MSIFQSWSGDLFALLLVLPVIIISYCKWNYQHWRRRNLPYLKPQIPFGNIKSTLTGKAPIGVATKQIYNEMKAKKWKHGGCFFLLAPKYFIIDLDLIKRITVTDFQYFTDRNDYVNERGDPLLGHLVNLKGAKWRIFRKKLSPVFTSGKIKNMFEIFLKSEVNLRQTMEAKCSRGEPINVKDALTRFSIDIIGSCGFGLDCQTFENENPPIMENAQKFFEFTRMRRFKNLFLNSFPKLSLFLGLTETPKVVEDFFMGVVRDSITYREENHHKREDILQLLIELKNDNFLDDNRFNSGKRGLTFNEVAAQSFSFFFGSFETSSIIATYALYELAKNKNIQQKLREEIGIILNKYGGQITYDSIQELKYMDQVIDETLRKYPPIPFTNRTCVKDYKLPDVGTIIEKGTSVMIPILGIHHDEDYYPDPYKFDPDRFSPDNKKSRPQFTHLPFGEGPRICIGMRFGLMQSKVGLTSVVKNFKFTLNKNTAEPLQMMVNRILLCPVNDIWLNVEKI